MKKIALALVLTLTLACGNAQEGRVSIFSNTFASGGIGLAFHSPANQSASTASGFAMNVAAGKWILQPLAMRIDAGAAMLSNNEGESSTYTIANLEFMWDILSAFGSIENPRVNVYPIAGLGVYMLSGSSSTSNLQTMFGLHVPVRILNGLSAFAEYKNIIIPYDGKAAHINMATIGATYNFNYTPYNRRSEYATRGMFEDWFLGYGIGANVTTFDFKGWDDFGRYSIMPEIMIGRNYTPRWTLRFELSGLYAHEFDNELFRYTDFHADVMFNLTNTLDFVRGRRLGIMPYIGAGPVWRYDNPIFTMCANGGLFLRYYLSQSSDIFLDVKHTFMPHYVVDGANTNMRIGVGITSLTFGYIYNIGTSTTRYRVPVGR
ncbi:MAG: porin family protein [Bacteroidales bacterium]|nr:porin family protein [Bacteroidales bacterium]